METINIQFQVPSTGQYTLDEFVAKLKDYAEKLASSNLLAELKNRLKISIFLWRKSCASR